MTTDEKREIVYNRDNYKCRVCGKHVSSGRSQMAHLIGNTKLNKKRYGKVIDSIDNVVTTCSLKCNKKADLGQDVNLHCELITIIHDHMRESERKALIDELIKGEL